MNSIKKTKKLIITAIIAHLLTPTVSRCAALSEESDISPEQQQELNERLWDATMRSDFAATQAALRDGANPNAYRNPDLQGLPILHERRACWENEPILTAFIKAGVDFNTPVRSENNLSWLITLHKTSVTGHAYPTKVLIESGADLNIQDENERTPLIHVIEASRLYSRPGKFDDSHYIVQLLINAGANLDIRSKQGNTALMEAVLGGRIDLINLLISAGADDNVQDNNGKTAIELALIHHKPAVESEIQKALKEREYEQQIHTQNILCSKQPIPTPLQQACLYLLDKPLPIDMLTRIFLSYSSNSILLAQHKSAQATIIQRKRAEETQKKAAAWQAEQRARRKAEAARQKTD